MEILKIIEQLQTYPENVVACKLDGCFANAVTEAASLLVSQGERIAELEEQSRWIPVTERMPEDDLPKDSKVKQIKVFVAYITNGRWVTRTQIRVKGYWYGAPDVWDWVKASDPITHWMPLPEPPKEVDE